MRVHQPPETDSISDMTAKFGLGLAALGRPGYINLGHGSDLENNYSIRAMEKRAHQVLDEAWQLGVRYFDAARSYGRAEEFLGNWIRDRNIEHSEITVGSKWGYTYTAAWQVQTPEGVAHEIKRHELKVLKSQYMTSMKSLGAHLKLYQIHSATLESGVLENAEVLECLNSLRKIGIRIGLSVSGPAQAATIEKAISIKFEEEPLFDSVQATWNLLETSAGAALQLAHDAGLHVIVKEGLANGRLTSRNDEAAFSEKMAVLKNLAAARETSVDALALAVVLNKPWAGTVLSGACTPEQMRSNFAASTVNCENVQTQLASISEPADEYWKFRSSLAWN